MAQNVPKPAKSRVTPSRVTKSPVAAAPTARRTRRDRRKIMVQVMAFLLVIALLLPIVAAFL